MGIITLNGQSLGQPSSLKEEYVQKVVDRTSILGVRHRYWLAAKYEVTMVFTALDYDAFGALALIFYNEGAGLTYYNSNSNLTFFGYPLTAVAEYYKGASFLRDMTVKLEQQ